MSPIEGLTVIHVLAAVLGTLLFLVCLGLFVRSGIKFNTYPKMLVVCIVIGATLTVFPVTKKFEVNSLISEMAKLSKKVEKNPNDKTAKMELEKKILKLEKAPSLSPNTVKKLDDAKILLQKDTRIIKPLKPAPMKPSPN